MTFSRPQFRRQRPGFRRFDALATHNTHSVTRTHRWHARGTPHTRGRHALTHARAQSHTHTHTCTHTGRKIPDQYRWNCLLTFRRVGGRLVSGGCHWRGRPMIIWMPIATAVPCPPPRLACVPCYVHVSKACSHQWHRLLPLRFWHQFTLPARTAIRF